MSEHLRRWPGRAAFLVAVLGLLVLGTGRAAAVIPPKPTAIEILQAPTETTIGQGVTISARITAAGQPVTSRLLVLQLDGTTLRTASVDKNGVAQLAIRGPELSHAHTATVVIRFPGAPALTASSASFTLVVKPAEVTIETVPTTDGISVSLGTMTAVTMGGVAKFEVGAVGQYTLTPDIAASATANIRVDFVRWSDDVFTATRVISITGSLALQLGLHVAYRESMEFRDASGALLDSSEIHSVTLTSTSGLGRTLTGNYQDVWLEGGTAVMGATGPGTGLGVTHATGLVASSRSWRVVGVWIHGTNVVNRGQQSAQPAPGAVWVVTVLLFDLSVEAHDAILGFPLSGTVDLEYPDGKVVAVKLGSSSALDFRRLPRGNYTLRVHTGGLAASTPVALSRSQATVIRVITVVDLAMAGSVALIAVAALLWLGRRRQIISVVTGVQRRLAMGRQATSAEVTRLGRTTSSRNIEITSRLSSPTPTSGEPARSELSLAEVMRLMQAPAPSGESLTGDPRRPSSESGGAARPAISRRVRAVATCPRCGRFVSQQARTCAACGFPIPGLDR